MENKNSKLLKQSGKSRGRNNNGVAQLTERKALNSDSLIKARPLNGQFQSMFIQDTDI